MPQMAPLMWLILYMSFIFIFLMFNILNYFNFYSSHVFSNQENKKTHNIEKKMIWKW